MWRKCTHKSTLGFSHSQAAISRDLRDHRRWIHLSHVRLHFYLPLPFSKTCQNACRNKEIQVSTLYILYQQQTWLENTCHRQYMRLGTVAISRDMSGFIQKQSPTSFQVSLYQRLCHTTTLMILENLLRLILKKSRTNVTVAFEVIFKGKHKYFAILVSWKFECVIN